MAQASANPGPSQGSGGGNEGYTDEDFIRHAAHMWDMEIKPQDLQHLKPEFVQTIYLWFLKDIGISIERYNQIPPQLIERIQYPDEYMESLRFTMLAADMRKHMKRIFNDDSFRLADIWNPRPKRSRRFFTMIFDFLEFSDGCFPQVDKVEEKVAVLMEQKNKMRAKLHKLQQQISERKTANAKNQITKEEEMRRVEAKTEELRKCQEERLVLKGQHDALGHSLANLSLAIKETELEIVEAKSEKQRLEGLVIQPQEEQEIKKRNDKLALLKEENQKKKEHMGQLQQRLQEMASVREVLDKFTSMLQEIQQDKAKEKETQAASQQTVTKITELQDDIKEETHKNLQMTQQLTAAETKLQRLHQEWHLKRESLDKEIAEKRQVLESAQQAQTEQDIVCKEMTQSIVQLDQQLKQSRERVASINAMVRKNYNFIKDKVLEGNANLIKAVTESECCEEGCVSGQ